MQDVPITREYEVRLAQLKNREWLDKNIDEIQKQHADRWIAILDAKIVASSYDVAEARSVLGDREDEAIVVRIPKDTIATPI